jgi:hypothetical protein
MKIRVVGNYNLVISHTTGIINLQDIYLSCDTSEAPVNIYLPKISSLKTINAIINVDDFANNSGNNPITIYAAEGDTVSGASNKAIIFNSGGGVLRIASNKDWIFSSRNVPSSIGDVSLIGSFTPLQLFNAGELMKGRVALAYGFKIGEKPQDHYIRNYVLKIDEPFSSNSIEFTIQQVFHYGALFTYNTEYDWIGSVSDNFSFYGGLMLWENPPQFFTSKGAGMFLNSYNGSGLKEDVYLGFERPLDGIMAEVGIVLNGRASVYAVLDKFPTI